MPRPRPPLLLIGLLLLVADLMTRLQGLLPSFFPGSASPSGNLLMAHLWLAPVGLGLTFAGSLPLLRDRARLRSYQSRAQLSEKLLYVNGLLADTNRQLQASEERFRTSVQTMLDCFGVYSAIRDRTGRIVDFRVEYVNDAACVSNCLTREEQIGRGLCELLPAHRDSGLFEEYCRVVEAGQPLIKETLYYEDVYGQQRLTRAFDIRVSPLGDGFAATWRDVTDRKQMEANLIASEQRCHSLMEAVPQMVWTADAHGAVDYFNQRWYDYSGLTPAQSMGWAGVEAVHPDDRDRTLQLWNQSLAAAEPFEIEYRLRRHDGAYRWFISRSIPVQEADQIVSWIGTITDIHDQKQVQHELTALMEAVPAGIWVAHDPECHTVTANAHAHRLMRCPPGSIMTATPADERYPFAFKIQKQGQDVDTSELPMQQAGRTGQPQEGNFEFVFEDGSATAIYGRAVPLRDEVGAVRGVIGAFLDVTEQKQIAASLQQKQERLDLAQAIAQIGSFEWDIQTNTNIWSPELEALYGLQPGGFEGTYEAWRQRVHPDDLAKAEANLEAALATGEFLTEWRAVWPDGTVRWLHARARIFKDSQGQPVRMVGVNMDITDRKEAEAALQRSEVRSHQLVASNLIGVVFSDCDGRLLEANEAFLQMLGYSQEELSELDWRSLTPPDHLERDEKAIAELKARGVCTPFEKEYLRKDGSRVPILIGFTLLEGTAGECACFVLDLSKQKSQEEALRQSEQMFRTLADSMPQLFWVVRPDTYHEYVNQYWCDYTGKTLEQIQAHKTLDHVHPDDLPRVYERWHQTVDAAQDFEMEIRFRRASDGEYRWHLSRALPFYAADGRITRWFGSSTDIHDQKMAIEERASALERERSARIALERASRTKDEFLAIVSHELRSPLNGILGWARLLRTRRLAPDVTEKALGSIERNAQAQTQLIEDLLDISRIIRGNIRLNLCPTSLVPIIEAALDTVRPTAHTKGIRVIDRLDSAIGPVLGDPDRLQQIVWNLLSNGVKFTPEGGQVEISLTQAEGWVQIHVTDTGKGIDPDFLPYVFDRFRQADATATRTHGGLGLGLAIVRNLAELHGGSVAVTSLGQNQGATFTVRLPLQAAVPVSASRPPAMLRQTGYETAFDLQGLTLLVVDDEADTREFLQFLLEQYGARVAIATSVQEARQRLSEVQPDILLSDVGMPNEDGYSLIRHIRSLSAEQGGQIPAVALTAYARERDRALALDSGFNVHVPKPIEPIQLLSVLTRLAGR